MAQFMAQQKKDNINYFVCAICIAPGTDHEIDAAGQL